MLFGKKLLKFFALTPDVAFNGKYRRSIDFYRYELLTLAVLIFTTFLIYSNTLQTPFIFDDWRSIENNPNIRLTDFSIESIRGILFKSFHATRALPNFSFGLNYYFHQYQLSGYHLVNILIHALTGILLYSFINSLLKIPTAGKFNESSRWLAFTTALIWLVNPVHTQSVTYIVQRMNSMAAMFYLLSLFLYMQARLGNCPGRNLVGFTGSLLAGILAIFSKEIAATLPLFIFLFEWYFFQDLSITWLKNKILPLTIILTLLVMLTIVYLGGNPLEIILSTYKIRDFSVTQRLLTELRVVVFYISLLFFPNPLRLNLEHDFPLSSSLLTPFTTVLSFGLLAGVLFIAIGLAKRERLISFCLLWFLGNLLIESSFIGLELVFEHRNYLPSTMLLLAMVILCDRFLRSRWLKIGTVFLVVLISSFWTYERNMAWSDEVTLYLDSVKKSPHKLRPRFTLGSAFGRQNMPQEAIFHLSKALLYKDITNEQKIMTHSNLGKYLWDQGLLTKAADHFFEVLQIIPNQAQAVVDLAMVYEDQGKQEEAKFFLYKAIQMNPNYALAHNELGRLLLFEGNYREAFVSLSEALRLEPNYDAAHRNMQILVYQQARKKK